MRKNMAPKSFQGNRKENHASAKSVAAAYVGWMSEKLLLQAVGEKYFLLTSTFIEPAYQCVVAPANPTDNSAATGGTSPLDPAPNLTM